MELSELSYVLADASELQIVPLPAFEQLVILCDHMHLLIADAEAVLEDPLCNLTTSIVVDERIEKLVLDRCKQKTWHVKHEVSKAI